MEIKYKGEIYKVLDRLTDYEGQVCFLCEDLNSVLGGSEFIVSKEECEIINKSNKTIEQLIKENEILKDKIKDLSKNSGAINRTDTGFYTVDFSKNETIEKKIVKDEVRNYKKQLILDYSNDTAKIVYSPLYPTKEEVFQMIEALLQLKTID